ncbi:hypothetical protein ABZ840_01985 [Streptomyces sp. NPDC047117]|uniref:hypothetical protein n=1 Tax=Streptomyces sp. NPDC047117 TaxID=3155379 RepID=UPI00340EA41E
MTLIAVGRFPTVKNQRAAATGTGPDDVPDDVWVSAEAVTGVVSVPLLYHWNGHDWTVREVPTPTQHPTGWVANHIVATGRNSVHVLGCAACSSPATCADPLRGQRSAPLPFSGRRGR